MIITEQRALDGAPKTMVSAFYRLAFTRTVRESPLL